MSEYGFQGMPSLNAFNKFCDGNELSLKSEAVKNHQKHPTGYETIQQYLAREYRQPKKFENYIYVSQLLQAEGIRTAIEAHRRAKPYCMGTLYWQLNDCWPVTSWSSTDYDGEWKALHYAVKNAYQDILVSPVIENQKLKITTVNDKQLDLAVEINMELMDFKGSIKWKESKLIVLKKNSSREIFSIDTLLLLKNSLAQQSIFHVEILSEKVIVADHHFYFTEIKNLELPKPNFTITPGKTVNNRQQFEISSDVIAKNVYLAIPGKLVIFSDNFFDMLPGKKYLIWSRKGDLKSEDVSKIKIKSLVDSY